MGMIFTKIFFLKSSLLFREIFWLDCILSGFNTLMPSRYYFLLQRYYIYGMFLRKIIVDFLQKLFGLIVFYQALPTYTNSKSLYRVATSTLAWLVYSIIWYSPKFFSQIISALW